MIHLTMEIWTTKTSSLGSARLTILNSTKTHHQVTVFSSQKGIVLINIKLTNNIFPYAESIFI